jgi:hypothetical protein
LGTFGASIGFWVLKDFLMRVMWLIVVFVQVGLLIGKLEVSSSRDSVFALVPTPAKDGEEAAKVAGAASGQKEGSGKKNAKAKSTVDNSSLVLDTDWIAEHSRQVRYLNFGGDVLSREFGGGFIPAADYGVGFYAGVEDGRGGNGCGGYIRVCI